MDHCFLRTNAAMTKRDTIAIMMPNPEVCVGVVTTAAGNVVTTVSDVVSSVTGITGVVVAGAVVSVVVGSLVVTVF